VGHHENEKIRQHPVLLEKTIEGGGSMGHKEQRKGEFTGQ
jgi:hypothetical protein